MVLKLLPAIVLSSLLQQVGGCLDDSPTKPATTAKQPVTSAPTHRFVLSRTTDLAFDTQTGQLCRTWDWKPLAPAQKPNSSGDTPERMTGEFTPTCLTLYSEYPTRNAPGDSVVVSPDSTN